VNRYFVTSDTFVAFGRTKKNAGEAETVFKPAITTGKVRVLLLRVLNNYFFALYVKKIVTRATQNVFFYIMA